MAALQQIEALLNRATISVAEAEVVKGRTVEVARIDEGTRLVYGIFPYPRRAIGVPGRLLTTEVTYQPVLALEEGLEEGQRLSPLAYAEDVERHPLREVLVGYLATLNPKLS